MLNNDNDNENYLEDIISILFTDFPNGISLQNVSDIVIKSMKLVGKIPNLEGYEKKKLVLDAVNLMADKHDAGKFDDQIDMVIKFVAPKLIDNLILVEDGKLKFNKKGVSECFGLKSMCFGEK